MPVYNDWAAAARLLPLIDRTLASLSRQGRVLLVDDASTSAPDSNWLQTFTNIETVSILHLRRNLGHQRAIAIGLVYVYQDWVQQQSPGVSAVIVMDADGEDRPQDFPALLEAFASAGESKIVFAARVKRLEDMWFRFSYQAYRTIHKALTGVAVRVGNFSVMPSEALGRLMVVSEIWNHYAAAVLRSRIPYMSVPIPRGPRLEGRSRMDFVALLVHGLSAISVFSDVVGARLLTLTAFAAGLDAVALATLAGLRLFTGLAIPNWTGYTAGILLVVLVQALVVSLALVFLIVAGRAAPAFLPLRDAPLFIDRVEHLRGDRQ
jgi:polyisoprenyl-phosphate glycosyltransferase